MSFERVVIHKPSEARGFQRPIPVADLNGDGRLDLFGMLVHEDGDLPDDKMAAFWMEYRGSTLDGHWTTHVIKWGSGRTMLIPAFGEKWDQVDLRDVDGDGDLDVVADCEEWWEAKFDVVPFYAQRVAPESVAVVWFENRLDEPVRRFEERGGVAAIEAERYTNLRDGTWYLRTTHSGYAGEGYLQDGERLDVPSRRYDETSGAVHDLDLGGGSYTVWTRRWVPSQWGAARGRGQSNSAWVAFDDDEPAVPFDDQIRDDDTWTWVRASEPADLSPGRHRLTVRVRECGYAIDRLVLSADPAFEPEGKGPDETELR